MLFRSCGSDVTLSTGASAGYTLAVSGNSTADRIIFGAYYMDGGSPVHEDDSPVFGQNCGNAAQKPKLTKDNFTAAIFNQGVGVNYIELNSLQLIDGEAATYIDGNYNVVRYCYIDGASWGVKAGGSASSQYAYVGYNYIFADYSFTTHDKDAIAYYGYADYGTIEYNVVGGTGHAAIAVYGTGTTDVTVQYNRIFDTDDNASECILLSSSSASVHHNWCEDAGIVQITGHDNYFYSNVINGINDRKTNTGAINIQPIGYNNYNNQITNNTIFFDGNEGATIRGIYLQEPSDSAQTLKNNVIANNIVLNANTIPFLVYDPYDQIESNEADADANVWYNNLAYNWDNANLVSIEGTYVYTNAIDWNTEYDKASGNIATDPSLSNPAGGEFWPDDSGDPVVGTGYTLASPYDQLIVPGTSDFTLSPPVVNLETQSPNNIGAYKSSDAGPVAPTYPLQGVAGSGYTYQ